MTNQPNAERAGATSVNPGSDTKVKQASVIAIAIILLSLISLFLYNGVEELRISKNSHELVRRQRLLRKHNLFRQYDRDHNKVIDQEEANFGALNSYQF